MKKNKGDEQMEQVGLLIVSFFIAMLTLKLAFPPLIIIIYL